MVKFLSDLIWLSAAGTILGGVLFVIGKVTGGRLGKRLLYGLWLLVLLRLCLPFGGIKYDMEDAAARPIPDVVQKWSEATETVQQRSTASSVTVLPAPVETAPVETKPVDPAVPADLTTPVKTTPVETTPVEMISADPAMPEAGNGTLSRLGELLRTPETWFYVWLAGALIKFLYYIFGYILLQNAVVRGEAEVPENVRRIFPRLYWGERVTLTCSHCARSPMIMGIVRPKIVLPAREYTDENAENILRHELSHYRRGDVLTKWFAMTVFCIHWFNPFMILFQREITRSCELACDERVVREMDVNSRQRYGETLISLSLSEKVEKGALTTAMSGKKKDLKGRIISIMKYRKSGAMVVAASILLCLTLCAGAAISGVPDMIKQAAETQIDDEKLQEQQNDEAQNQKVTENDAQPPVDNADYVAAYGSVFENYQNVLLYQVDDLPEKEWKQKNNKYDLYGADLRYTMPGYTFMDVDNNGVKELLVGDIDAQGAWKDMIWGMFTLVNGKPVKVFEGEGSRYYLTSDGIYYEDSSGAAYSTKSIYAYSGTELTLQDSVYTDGEDSNGDTICRRTIRTDKGYSDYAITNKEFTKWIAPEILSLPELTPMDIIMPSEAKTPIGNVLKEAQLKDVTLGSDALGKEYEFFIVFNTPLATGSAWVYDKDDKDVTIDSRVATEYEENPIGNDINSIRVRMTPEAGQTYTVRLAEVVAKDGRSVEEYSYKFYTEGATETNEKLSISDVLVEAQLKDVILDRSWCWGELGTSTGICFEFFVVFNTPLAHADVTITDKNGNKVDADCRIATEYDEDAVNHDIKDVRIQMRPETNQRYQISLKNIVTKDGRAVEDYSYNFYTESQNSIEDTIKELFLAKLKAINNSRDDSDPFKLLDYRVDKVEILSDDELKHWVEISSYYDENDILAAVTYSVKPRDVNAIAGNGKISGDWQINKVSCECLRNGKLEYTTGFATSW